MSDLPTPPDTSVEFCRKFPTLAEAWQPAGEAGEVGPLDERTRRLVKLAVSIGAMREGAVHSAVRKAAAAGVTPADVDQVLALAASTSGFPATVAAFSWVRDQGFSKVAAKRLFWQGEAPAEPRASARREPRRPKKPTF
jgi:alkylhydroperoxidase/carboxymuconolactone decarboxylase family protein YurZ